MSAQLCIGDVALVYVNNKDETQHYRSPENIRIGIIKYIGYIHCFSMTEYIGMEIVEPIDNGHNGIIAGYQYFECPEGHGIHTNITNILRKLEAAEIATKMSQIIILYKERLDQYIQAVSQRDEYIEELKHKKKYLRNLLKDSRDKVSADKLNEIQTEILSNNISKYEESLVTPKKDGRSNIFGFDQTDIAPITPMTPMGPSPDASGDEYTYRNTVKLIPNNSNSTVIFHNIDKKECIFKFDKKNEHTSIRKATEIFTPKSDVAAKSVYNKKKKLQIGIHSTKIQKYWNKHREYTKYSDVKKYKHKIKRIETPQTEESELESSQSISRDEITETETDYDDDDESPYSDIAYNMNSPYSITAKRASRVPSVTPVSDISSNIGWTKRKSRNIKPLQSEKKRASQLYPPAIIPSNKSTEQNGVGCILPINPPQQQYAYSHISYDQSEKQRGNINNIRDSRPSLPNLYHGNQYLIPSKNALYANQRPVHPDYNKNIPNGIMINPQYTQQYIRNNISSQSKPQQQHIQYPMNIMNNNNNKSYYHPTRIEQWIQQQQH